MKTTRLQAFSDGVIAIKVSVVLDVIAILLVVVSPWISAAIYAGVALMWLAPDRRIEGRLHP